jgi:hypothetical protein
MTKIFSEFPEAVIFLCYFLLMEQKKVRKGPRGLSAKGKPQPRCSYEKRKIKRKITETKPR